MPKTPAVQKPPSASPTNSEKVEVVYLSSRSPNKPEYDTADFRLDWDNNLSFHIAENLIQLRRMRGKSQSELAEMTGTSQSAIARVESGQENIKVSTLVKLCGALNGRIQMSISPAERHLPIAPNWWELLRTGIGNVNPWRLRGIAVQSNTELTGAAYFWAAETAPCSLPDPSITESITGGMRDEEIGSR